MDLPPTRTPLILFLDDAPDCAASFLAAHPGAVWVQTVEQCLELLEQPWDEVHLDHVLGGKVLVDHERADCKMAVIRWLCQEPRPHLQGTRFIVHTHNPNAARMIGLHLKVTGFNVEAIRTYVAVFSHFVYQMYNRYNYCDLSCIPWVGWQVSLYSSWNCRVKQRLRSARGSRRCSLRGP